MKYLCRRIVAGSLILALSSGCATVPNPNSAGSSSTGDPCSDPKDMYYTPQLSFPADSPAPQQRYNLKAALIITPTFLQAASLSEFNNVDKKDDFHIAQVDIGQIAGNSIKKAFQEMFPVVDVYNNPTEISSCNKYDLVVTADIASSGLKQETADQLVQRTKVTLVVSCPDSYANKNEFEGSAEVIFPRPENLTTPKSQEIARTLAELTLENALLDLFSKLENSSDLQKYAASRTQNTDGSFQQKEVPSGGFNTFAKTKSDEDVKLELTNRLDAINAGSDSGRTIAEAVAAGAVVGGAIGQVSQKDTAGTLIGALAGGAVGLVAGVVVAGTKAAFIAKEDCLEMQIANVAQNNSNLNNYNTQTQAVLNMLNQEVSSLKSRYDAGTAQVSDLKTKQDAIQQSIKKSEERKNNMNKELSALTDYIQSLQQSDKNDKITKLDEEVKALKANIEGLDSNSKQLAQLVESLNVVRK